MAIKFLKGGGQKPTGDAQPENVLSPKTFSNIQGINKVGTMVNRGSVVVTPSKNIQNLGEGYYSDITVDGDMQLVPENILEPIEIFGVKGTLKLNDASTGNAQPLQVLEGYSFSNSEGVGKIGEMINHGNKIIVPSTENQELGRGFIESLIVNGDIDFLPENIKDGIELFGKTGTFKGGIANESIIPIPAMTVDGGETIVGKIITLPQNAKVIYIPNGFDMKGKSHSSNFITLEIKANSTSIFDGTVLFQTTSSHSTLYCLISSFLLVKVGSNKWLVMGYGSNVNSSGVSSVNFYIAFITSFDELTKITFTLKGNTTARVTGEIPSNKQLYCYY